MRWIWHLTEDKGWQRVQLHDVDAKHAASVDPGHWSFDDPRVVPEIIEPASDETSTSDNQSTGDQA